MANKVQEDKMTLNEGFKFPQDLKDTLQRGINNRLGMICQIQC